MKIALISDITALGIMEARPEPAWKVRLSALRNKDMLAPDYGSMHVLSYLKSRGINFYVINLMADVHRDIAEFEERESDPESYSKAPISRPEAARKSREYLFSSLSGIDPEIILYPLSIYNLALYSRRLLSDVRRMFPGSTIITGGIYASFHAEEILQEGNADIVVRGEGEVKTAKVIESLKTGAGLGGIEGISFREGRQIRHNPDGERISNLDALPHPYTASDEFKIRERYELLSALNPADDYIPGTGFLTSRGCPEFCTFCLDPAINKGVVRFHSPGYVREVLGYCRERFGDRTGTFFFGDATFTMNKKRLRSILNFLCELPCNYQIQTRADYLDMETIRELSRCRFTAVAIGAESFNERVLNEVVGKRISPQQVIEASLAVKKAGINPVLTFIVGLPGESKSSVLKTVETLIRLGLTTATFFPLVVFKGTALFEEFKRRFSPSEREALRLNPASEEFLFLGEDFSDRDDLTEFTSQINTALVEERSKS